MGWLAQAVVRAPAAWDRQQEGRATRGWSKVSNGKLQPAAAVPCRGILSSNGPCPVLRAALLIERRVMQKVLL
ncbi:hypothetical protein CTTA_3607 [Comamonas testosteroni]|uniref:Uncharacterized protein n=1 Tax=Comamonas testosteroni TaxID=285 RepID=A0A5A7MG18_COMTE|nr:hypothetical protein CTTA_3607 [Comamonas testosteroni]